MRHHVVALVLILTCACTVDPAERNNAANAYQRDGNTVQAIQVFQQAQVAAPDNALPYFNSALAYEQNGDTNLAISALKQAVTRGDTNQQAWAHYNLGNLYFRSNQISEAIAAYKEALRLDTANADARYNLELALLYAPNATPTPIEMQQNPEAGSVDPTAQPSPAPVGNEFPTPTPSPESPSSPTPDSGGNSGENVAPNLATPAAFPEGKMDVETAMRILIDTPFQQDNMGLRPPLPIETTPSSLKDW